MATTDNNAAAAAAAVAAAEERAASLAAHAVELVNAGRTEVHLPTFAISPSQASFVEGGGGGNGSKPAASFTTIPLPSPPDSPQQSRPLTPSQEGSRALREAAALAPNNARVRDAFVKIHYDESLQPLLRLCRRYQEKHDVAAAKEALWYLNAESNQVPAAIAEQSLRIALDADAAGEAEVKDDLVASLLENCLGARQYAAKKFSETATPFFATLFALGDSSAIGITRVALDEGAWPDQEQRVKCVDDVFQLFLAKLLEADTEHDGRAVKGIARHLAASPARLAPMIDEYAFAAILTLLDYRLPPSIRGQAVLATAKYLEVAKQDGEQYLTRFITDRTKKHGSEDLVLAFSCAAEAFPIATQTIASLFLIDGFLPSLIPLLDKKSRPIKVEKAALDMLSAACIDSTCRKAIAKHCLDWMHHVMDDKDDERHGQAAVILAKVQDSVNSDGKQRRRSDIVDVVPTLKSMLSSGTEMDRRAAVEGLAYASLQPFVKEEIAYDENLLKKLFEAPKKDSVTAAKAFGALTLLNNLTYYQPKLTEEQEKMYQLKAYANASKPSEPEPLEKESHVSARCVALIDAGVVPFLVALRASAVNKPLTPTALSLIATVINNLSHNRDTRGRIAQQGSVPLLLSIFKDSSLDSTSIGKSTAAHAMARILISIDPKLIAQHANSVLVPLVTLLTPPETVDGGPRNFLATFESLIALTNLVSNPNLSCGPNFVRSGDGKAFATLEDLLLHDNTLVRRAATELLCNLVTTCPEGIEKLADGSPAAGRRMHVLLALADVDDLPTRQAAGGALAGVTEFDGAVSAVLNRERGLDVLFGLCGDEDAGCVHRGVVCLSNMCLVEDQVGAQAKETITAKGGQEVLKAVIRGRREQPIIEAAVEALKQLIM